MKTMLLILSIIFSPYWIESYQETFSSFKHMGLWEYCFEQFRYPYYQFDKQFDGCHHIFSQEYYVIREWLLPVWLMVVQTFVTLALMLSIFAFIVIALIWTRWPLRFVLRYEWILSSFVFVCNATAGKWEFLKLKIEDTECSLIWLFFNFRRASLSGSLYIRRTMLASGLVNVSEFQSFVMVIWSCCHIIHDPYVCCILSLFRRADRLQTTQGVS